MSKRLTPQAIVTRFYRDRILFCSLGCVAGFSVVVLMVSPGLQGSVSFPLWVLQIPTLVITIGTMIVMLSLGNCPACGRSPYSNSQNPFPTRCNSCGVRLL
ncbi:hypothetical protein [Chamaesiphon sp.]|uniref:hypothetical protein n=1 Tax=Chamaesiphon sp. TaxID=2814140 RepID=UPI0035930514